MFSLLVKWFTSTLPLVGRKHSQITDLKYVASLLCVHFHSKHKPGDKGIKHWENRK